MSKALLDALSNEDLQVERRNYFNAAGKYTSVALERSFWRVFDAHCAQMGTSWKEALKELDAAMPDSVVNFAGFLRVALLTSSTSPVNS